MSAGKENVWDLNKLIAYYWEIVHDHEDDCNCIDCWEYYVLTEK